MTTNVKTLKMTNGDELVVEVVKENLNGDLVIKNPIQVVMAEGNTTAFFPYIISADETQEFDIKKDLIFVCADTQKDIRQAFLKMHGYQEEPEIFMPSNKIIQ